MKKIILLIAIGTFLTASSMAQSAVQPNRNTTSNSGNMRNPIFDPKDSTGTQVVVSDDTLNKNTISERPWKSREEIQKEDQMKADQQKKNTKKPRK